jgi:hypothetical protein
MKVMSRLTAATVKAMMMMMMMILIILTSEMRELMRMNQNKKMNNQWTFHKPVVWID